MENDGLRAVALIVGRDHIPAIIAEPDDRALLERLRTVKDAPELEDIATARAWLSGLPAPSGWYASAQEARDAVAAFKRREALRKPKAVSP